MNSGVGCPSETHPAIFISHGTRTRSRGNGLNTLKGERFQLGEVPQEVY